VLGWDEAFVGRTPPTRGAGADIRRVVALRRGFVFGGIGDTSYAQRSHPGFAKPAGIYG